MSPELLEFIKNHRALFWYTPEAGLERISNELLVETILNYGTIDSFKKMAEIIGIVNVSKIFYDSINKSGRRKGNYHKTIVNFFDLVLKRYALPNS